MYEKLKNKEINERLAEFTEWDIDSDTGKLFSTIEMESFKEAIEFVDRVAEIAEELDHHPDILIYDYKYVQIFTHTHSVEGITEKDFELIRRIDNLFTPETPAEAKASEPDLL